MIIERETGFVCIEVLRQSMAMDYGYNVTIRKGVGVFVNSI